MLKKGGGGTKYQSKLNFFFGPKLPKLSKVFPVENAKIALAHAPMVVIYYIKFFGTHNGILMSLLRLIVETVRSFIYCFLN